MTDTSALPVKAQRRFDGDKLLAVVCVAIPLIGLMLFFVYPMVVVFLRSITTPDETYGLQNYAEVLTSKGFWRATRHSMTMGAATTLLSVFLGFIIAHGLHRCAFRGKRLIRAVIVLPLLAPSLVQALGLIFFLGRIGIVSRSIGYEIDIYGFWECRCNWRRLSVLATEIYTQVIGLRNFNMGAVVGILLLLPTVVSYYIERQAMKRQRGQHGTDFQKFIPSFMVRRDIPMATACFLIVAMILSVIGIVVYASFVKLWPYNYDLTFKHYDITLAGGYSSLWITIVISLGAAVGGTFLIFILALGLRRLPAGIAQAIQVLAAMPAAVPGIVLGLAYILTFNSTATPLYLLYGTAALIAIINFYHFHTQAFLTVMTGFRQFPTALEEAANSLGAGLARTAINVIAPFVAPMLVSVFFFLFMRSMVTLSAVVFLTTPKLDVAAVTIMRLDDAGLTSQAAAFSTCIMAVVCLSLGGMKVILAVMSRKQSHAKAS